MKTGQYNVQGVEQFVLTFLKIWKDKQKCIERSCVQGGGTGDPEVRGMLACDSCCILCCFGQVFSHLHVSHFHKKFMHGIQANRLSKLPCLRSSYCVSASALLMFGARSFFCSGSHPAHFILFYFFIYLVAPGLSCGTWAPQLPHANSQLQHACGIQFPNQGLNLGPLHWECGVLTTAPPGKSPSRTLRDVEPHP